MSIEWVTIAVSNAPLLDELLAALRDAGIEVRTSPVGESLPQLGVRTYFGERHADDRYVEVAAADQGRAAAVVEAVFADAEAAAYHASGAALPSQAERDEEAAWRAAQEERQRRIDRRFKRALQVFFLLVAAAIGFAIVAPALR